MIRTVIKWVLISAVILLILLWLWAGGFTSVRNFVRTIPNPIDIIWGNATSTYQINLPWQSAIPQGPDISGLTDAGDAQLDQTPEETGAASGGTQTSYGVPSPYRGMVALSQANAREGGTVHEYLELDAREGISAVPLTGWSLQSMVSGVRVPIPGAAAPFIIGVVNQLSPVVLAPGQTALVVTGPSPVGVSFRENRCTGFLEQVQSFDPALANACPASSELAPLTAENLHQYGSDCMDFARSLPQCSFPVNLPSSLTPGCRAYLVNTFTYSNCVDIERSRSSFELDTWRIYLSSASELWDNQHDIIRLLDAQGRTVAAISY
ncbi:hypothetical protein A3C20_03975 [Candidatus Kaiserbacteria bacterium RIFCSPHIGHO2_02_FULL_55_25]|uniref:LTD domain-containing protein n=1 Tax=Candidatus Kaiserbacteria bacterium RIFCSPHIGHO2_02_FULL_55_25 TaxID=1798498 RepID=A0A1F6E7Y1_9BACT|nr:MAG: hypothetical protein A2764_00615 [Candidatus Kaiserbacteria bacterium RIFCSPHIGHO2_01_FULL_55_79]OGG69650.1 MAG: hypothetical protein A3C20_03975 [Candidatus Kaiserbacteria bacterium RIFCSPHIGHO2_02_FULL_55_25]OGG77209.1 MAG: hypothetical protein A3F56_04960 [Candidatus Kaiserbacteria bacterium RIFCSPHIGHO2_12_FULL_55_13]OGG83308.1 MAG: hypothetical protein A3A42_01890 [Candidatus Kaiserbacteria bacterium RIFCSPLOWO2_01_FULL_55_25]